MIKCVLTKRFKTNSVKVVSSVAQFQNRLNDFAVSLVNLKQKYYYHKGQDKVNFAHQCYSVSINFNETFEFICENDYLDLFNFEHASALYGITPPR